MRRSDVVTELVQTAKALIGDGLVRGAGGNVSAREDETMWISPSGFSLAEAGVEDYVGVGISSGELTAGEHRPSSEVLMHLAIYRSRTEENAVIHTHPPTMIALTAAGHDLRPMFADYYVYLGRNVPHLPYVTVTTAELSAAVKGVVVDPDCYGIVLRNHGAITVGKSVKEAYFRTLAIEEQAIIQHAALQVGYPEFLGEEELTKLDELGSEAYRRQLLASMKG